VSGSVLRFERVYGLPREIVWDALVDSDLLSGWLAEADVDPRVGGRFDLRWSHFTPEVRTDGEIVELLDLEVLVVETSDFGRTTFTLETHPGGDRGSSTLLVVDVHAIADLQFSRMIDATWRISLEQLERLLHGHPVNWASWAEDSGAEWLAHVKAAHRP
jgi:uncharacterized protein YndB with AHSA1/START domain